jgi:uncharacterized protein (TIRG00374 family)
MTDVPADALINDLPPEDVDLEEMPRVPITRRRALLFGIFVICAVGFLYFLLPRITGLSETWNRARQGDPWWLAVAFGLEVCSFGGYIMLFRTVFIRGGSRINWRESYEITMASLAATRLFAGAGAGGIVLTAWALRRSGMDRRTVACRMIAFLCLLYAVYMCGLVIDGIGLRTGIFPGEAPFAATVIPAIFAAAMIAVFVAVSMLPHDVERRLELWAHGSGRVARWMAKAVSVPASAAQGIRTAIGLIREREAGVIGAVFWWAFDISVLWASFHAFGSDTPPIAVIVMAYFVGMIANVLPLPGGIGGVDGGMIGAFAAFGVPFGYATVAVLVYRGFSFWLPTIPGAIAYLQLRRTVSRWREERAAERADRTGAEPVGA